MSGGRSLPVKAALVVLILTEFLIYGIEFWPLRLDTYVYCLRHGAVYVPELIIILSGLIVGIGFVLRQLWVSPWHPSLSPMLIFYAVYLLYHAISATVLFVTQSPFSLPSTMSSGAAVCGILCYGLLNKNVKVLLYIIVALISIEALYAVWDYCVASDHRFFSGTVHRAAGTSDPSALYKLLIVAIPLCFSLLALPQRKAIRNCIVVSAKINIVALILTWYRGGLVAIALALAVQAYLLRRGSRTLVVYVVCVLALLVILIPITFKRRSGSIIDARSSQKSIGGRVHLWKLGWHDAESHLLIGVGVGAIGYNLERQDGKPEQPADFRVLFRHVHNQTLNWVVEMGLYGLLFGLAVPLFLFERMIHCNSDPIIVGASISLLAMMVAGLTDVPVDATYEATAGSAVLFHILLLSLLFSDNSRYGTQKLQKNKTSECINSSSSVRVG